MVIETRVARQGVKLAVLGESPQFFGIETAPTLGLLLALAGVPGHMDVRLNHVSIDKLTYATIPLQEGDLIVAVPRIEGGK